VACLVAFFDCDPFLSLLHPVTPVLILLFEGDVLLLFTVASVVLDASVFGASPLRMGLLCLKCFLVLVVIFVFGLTGSVLGLFT